MTFENLAKLTDAKLLNTPFISSFERVIFDPLKVKRGDLFVGNDPQEIKTAIARDAYAILSDKKVNILDEEIAWLRCEDIEDALTGILRYYLMDRKLHFVYFDIISAHLMQHIVSKEEIIFLHNDAKQNFQALYSVNDNTIIICSDKHYLQNIYPGYETPDIAIYQTLQITKSSLFQTSFTYKEIYYENIKIPELFIKQFESILNCLDTKLLYYDITKCDYIPDFYPLFVNKELQIRPYGTTPFTLIVVKDVQILKTASNYLQNKAPWARTVLFLSKPHAKEINLSIQTIRYKNLSEIKKLKELEFNFAIINADLPKIVDILQNSHVKEQLSLF